MMQSPNDTYQPKILHNNILYSSLDRGIIYSFISFVDRYPLFCAPYESCIEKDGHRNGLISYFFIREEVSVNQVVYQWRKKMSWSLWQHGVEHRYATKSLYHIFGHFPTVWLSKRINRDPLPLLVLFQCVLKAHNILHQIQSLGIVKTPLGHRGEIMVEMFSWLTFA